MFRRRRADRAKPKPKRAPAIPDVVPVGLTLAELQAVAGNMFDDVADGSRNVYERHLEYFAAWREPRGISLPMLETTHIKVYLEEKTNEIERKRKEEGNPDPASLSVSWMYCAVAAIKKALEWKRLDDRVDWDDIAHKIRLYRKKSRHRPAGVDGITRELFDIILASAWRPRDGEWEAKTAHRAAFDAALISLMRDCLLRRSEAAAVKWGDIKVEITPGHAYGVLTIPFGKTDPFGNSDVGYVHISTMARLHEMAALRGRDISRPDQLVFGIGEKQVANRIKAACDHAGLMGRFSGHSCRVGMAIDLATYNTPLVGIMQSGRWRIPKTVMKYIKSIAAGDNAVAQLHASWDGKKTPRPVAWGRIL